MFFKFTLQYQLPAIFISESIDSYLAPTFSCLEGLETCETVFPFPSMEVHEQGLPNHPLWLPDSLWTKLGQGTVLHLESVHPSLGLPRHRRGRHHHPSCSSRGTTATPPLPIFLVTYFQLPPNQKTDQKSVSTGGSVRIYALNEDWSK